MSYFLTENEESSQKVQLEMEWAQEVSDSEEEDSVQRDPDWVKTLRVRRQRRPSIADNSGQVKVLGVENVKC